MAAPHVIVVDAYPLGNVALSLDQKADPLTDSQACRLWFDRCEKAGCMFIVPAIAYCEELREMELRSATRQITRLQNFSFEPSRFLPIAVAQLNIAAKLWASVRRTGQTTAARHALDGDCILAAQVLSLELSSSEYVVATRNVKHLTRFGLIADEWQNINP